MSTFSSRRVLLLLDDGEAEHLLENSRNKDGPVAASGRLREVWNIVVQHKVRVCDTWSMDWVEDIQEIPIVNHI